MRCLHCRNDGIKLGDTVCPKCGAIMPFLMRDVLIPGTALDGGKYRIDYPLGRGGFGITYRAFHVKLEKPYAIKEFFPQEHAMREGTTGKVAVPTTQTGDYQKALKRFLQEGQILSKLSHRNVVSVSDWFEERGTAYLVMQLLDGCTLRDRLDNLPDKRMAFSEVKNISDQIVNALEAIHSQKIYHLDISPDNIQMTSQGDVVLIDFGAARQPLSSASARAFKLAYAAPEVLAQEGGNEGPQSDLFELAMVLYELLTGSRPPSVLERSSGVEWRPEDVDEPWRTLLSDALQLDKEARPGSVREWWSRYREPHKEPRGSIVLPKIPKRVQKKAEIVLPAPSPLFKHLIDPRHQLNTKKKLKLGPKNLAKRIAPKRVQAQVIQPGVTMPQTQWSGKILKFMGAIVLSCFLGLAAYFTTYQIIASNSASQSSSYNSEQIRTYNVSSDDNQQHEAASFLGIAAFCFVSLGSFWGIAKWLLMNKNKADWS